MNVTITKVYEHRMYEKKKILGITIWENFVGPITRWTVSKKIRNTEFKPYNNSGYIKIDGKEYFYTHCVWNFDHDSCILGMHTPFFDDYDYNTEQLDRLKEILEGHQENGWTIEQETFDSGNKLKFF